MLLFQCRLLHNKFGAQQHECGCTVASRGGEHLCNASAQFNIREGWHFYVHAQTEGIRRMHQIHILLSVRRAVNMLKNFVTAMTWNALNSLWIFPLPWMEGALRCRSTYDHIKILWFFFFRCGLSSWKCHSESSVNEYIVRGWSESECIKSLPKLGEPGQTAVCWCNLFQVL